MSGAATQIRTGDLILTKDVLYQLSHSSIRPRIFPRDADYYIKCLTVCQYLFTKKSVGLLLIIFYVNMLSIKTVVLHSADKARWSEEFVFSYILSGLKRLYNTSVNVRHVSGAVYAFSAASARRRRANYNSRREPRQSFLVWLLSF